MIDIGYAGAFLGGILTLLSPCSAVLLPAFFAYAFASRTALFGRTLLLYAGLLTTLVPLGVAASTVGSLLTVHREALVMVMSIVVILLGLVQVLGIGFGLPGGGATAAPGKRDAASVISVYLLGTVYGVAGVCSGPILGSVLAVAALGTDLVYGGLLLAVYALGMVIPIGILALLWDRFDLGRKRWLRPKSLSLGPIRTTTTGVVAGVLFMAIGLLLLLTGGTADLVGVLSVDDQFGAELAIRKWSSSVPDWAAVVAGLAAVGAILTFAWRRASKRSERERSEVR